MECYNIYLLLWCIRFLSQSAGINPLRVGRVAHGWLPNSHMNCSGAAPRTSLDICDAVLLVYMGNHPEPSK